MIQYSLLAAVSAVLLLQHASVAVDPYGPVNCQVSLWSPWSACSVSCGSGVETRSRSVLVQASSGGEACPELSESRPCSRQCDVPSTTVAYATTTQRSTVHDVPSTTTYKPVVTTTTAYTTTTRPTVRDVPTTTTTTQAYTTTTVRDIPETTVYSTTTPRPTTTVRDVPVTTTVAYGTTTTVRDVPQTTTTVAYTTTTRPTIRDVPSTTTAAYTTTVRDVPQTTTTTVAYTTTTRPTIRDVPVTTTTVPYTTTKTTVRDVPVTTTTPAYTTTTTMRDVPITTTTGYATTTTRPTIRDVPATTTPPAYTTKATTVTIRDVPSTTTAYVTTTKPTIRDVPVTTTTTPAYTTKVTVHDVPQTTTTAAYTTTTKPTVRDLPKTTPPYAPTTTTTYATTTMRDVPVTTTQAPYTTTTEARTMPPTTPSTARDVPTTTVYYANNRVIRAIQPYAQSNRLAPGRAAPINNDKPIVSTTANYAASHKPVPPKQQGPCATLADGNYKTGDCKNEYFTCLDGEQLMQKCQDGLVFEESENRCEESENTETCTGTKPTKRPQADVTIPPSPTPNPEFDCSKHENGDYPNPKADKQCGQDYFTCSNGVTSKRLCPAGLWFDPELKLCDSWINVPTCSGQPRSTAAATEAYTKAKANFNCEGKEPGFYPDDVNKCSQKFYACLNGFADEMSCPDDLHYNKELEICDLREFIVDCGGSQRPETTTHQMDEPITLPPVNFDCSNKEDGYYADTANKCSHIYFSCTGHMARQLECNEDLVFSESEQKCERKDEAFECTGVKPTPTTTPVPMVFTTEKVNFDCAGKKSGHYNNPDEKCSNIYYICAFGRATKGLCPIGTFYDSEMGICDFRENVPQCTGGPRPTTEVTYPTTQAQTQPPEFDCSRQKDGLFPDLKSKCSESYFVCAHGLTTKQQCPQGLFFDPDLSLCDSFGHIFACSGSSRAPETTIQNEPPRTTPVPKFNCRGQPDGMYADTENKCSAIFYACSGGHTNEQMCATGLYFDASKQNCQKFQDILDCAGSTRAPTTAHDVPASSPLPPVPVDCKSLPTGDVANPEQQCSDIYYSCANGVGFKRQCPMNTFFDAEAGLCDIKANIPACSGSPRPPPTTTAAYQQYATTPSPFDCSNKASGNHPAGQCEAHYWVCNGLSAMRLDCPPGLFFDEEMNQCGFKSSIPSCGGQRPTPTIQQDIPVTPAQASGFDCSRRPDGDFPEQASQCSDIYFTCAGGKSYKKQCQAGLAYSSETGHCDFRRNIAVCAGNNIPATPAPRPVIQTPVQQPKAAPSAFVRTESSARSFAVANDVGISAVVNKPQPQVAKVPSANVIY